MENGKEVNNEEIVDYLKTLYTKIENNLELFALYTENYEQIYSNLKGIEELNLKSLLDQDSDIYTIKEINGKHYMLFTSHWSINNNKIYIINIYDVEHLYKERDRQLSSILTSDIIILAISSIIISVFSIYLTNPINSLNKISREIATGNYKKRVKIKNKDEIGELAENFNIMADEVEKKINELSLEVKKKDDFITGFTHELKTPMTSILGYSDLLRLKKCDEETSRKAINFIYSETKRLENISLKLMKLMQISKETIEMQVIDIKNFMQKISKSEENILKENRLILDIENAKILGDNELLEVVIRNLIENASKANPKDKKIIIKGKSLLNGKYRISIIDKGIGIPEKHIERVTEDFYMVDKSRSKQNGGTGIGLSLVQKILMAHNSKINIESKQNIGTTVYFDLEEGK